MIVRLHKNATTTPAIRKALQASSKSDRALAAEHRLTVSTVRRWRQRDDVQDRSHTPHRLQTTLTPAQEAVVVELRRLLLLPLDDLLAVIHEFLHPSLSRSALDRCLRRHGVARLADLVPKPADGEPPPKKAFKDYVPGYVHIDYKYLPQMPDETQRRYLFVAIDRATRWVYLEFKPDKSTRSATRFLKAVLRHAPFKVHRLLSDNDKCFTDRFSATGQRTPTGNHPLDRLCHQAGIQHRLIRPRHPQTNGMVERFNGRISEVLATTRFDSRLSLETTLKRYAYLYNYHIPQKALGHRPPIQALKDWQQQRPELFYKQVRNHPGPDT
jgi:transposase InsO family protein